MSLCPTAALLNQARKNKRAIGAFTIDNMEMLIGVIKAAESMNTPAILQVAEKRLSHFPLHLVAHMMVLAARMSDVPMAVHLDHGFSLDVIEKAVGYGFSSVMFDGSNLPLATNIAETAKVVALAGKAGVSVEAEIGVARSGGSGPEHQARYTDPAEAAEFAEHSGCSSLAVAVGNAHGQYLGKPALNFAVLEDIAEKVSVPLVLHDASGISARDFRHAIDLGISKIDVTAAGFDALAGAAASVIRRGSYDHATLSEAMVEGVYGNTAAYMAIFNNRDAA